MLWDSFSAFPDYSVHKNSRNETRWLFPDRLVFDQNCMQSLWIKDV